MTTLADSAFSSLNDDDLFDLFRPSNLNNSINSSDNYDDFVSSNLNTNSEELDYNFDAYDPVQNPSCTYLTENQFKNMSFNNVDETFSLLHLNIRSINKHFDDLQQLLANPLNNSFSLIGLTETWLSQSTNQPYALPGYDFVVNNRDNRIGGGVALYISSNYDYEILENLNTMNDSVESLFVEVKIPGNKNILVGTIYRPPNSNFKTFLLYVKEILLNPVISNKNSLYNGPFYSLNFFDACRH